MKYTPNYRLPQWESQDPFRRMEFNKAMDTLDAAIVVGAGKYGYLVTLTDDAGAPVAGVTITGVTTNTGGVCVTDEAGRVLGVSTARSVTLGAVSPFINTQNISKAVVSTGIITEVELEFPRVATPETTIASTRVFRFSSAVSQVDFTAVGGGGAGGAGGTVGPNYAGQYGGGGGGGGAVSTILNHAPNSQTGYQATIGAGAGVGTARGGTTAITANGIPLAEASGGYTGQQYTRGTGNGNGGSGWRDSGPSGTIGEAGVGYLYNEPELGLAGGGGGGGGNTLNSASPAGGRPNGAKGGRIYVDTSTNRYVAENAPEPTIPGGGGGGGNYRDSPSSNATAKPSAGAAGAVFVRWRYL